MLHAHKQNTTKTEKTPSQNALNFPQTFLHPVPHVQAIVLNLSFLPTKKGYLLNIVPHKLLISLLRKSKYHRPPAK